MITFGNEKWMDFYLHWNPNRTNQIIIYSLSDEMKWKVELASRYAAKQYICSLSARAMIPIYKSIVLLFLFVIITVGIIIGLTIVLSFFLLTLAVRALYVLGNAINRMVPFDDYHEGSIGQKDWLFVPYERPIDLLGVRRHPSCHFVRI